MRLVKCEFNDRRWFTGDGMTGYYENFKSEVKFYCGNGYSVVADYFEYYI